MHDSVLQHQTESSLLQPLYLYRLASVLFYTTHLWTLGKAVEKKGGERERCVAALGGTGHAYDEQQACRTPAAWLWQTASAVLCLKLAMAGSWCLGDMSHPKSRCVTYLSFN